MFEVSKEFKALAEESVKKFAKAKKEFEEKCRKMSKVELDKFAKDYANKLADELSQQFKIDLK